MKVVGFDFSAQQAACAPRTSEEEQIVRRFGNNYWCGLHKTDKYGRPLYIERTALVNPKQLLRAMQPEQLINSHVQAMEVLSASHGVASAMAGKRIVQHTVIMDLRGLGVHQFNWPGLRVLKECAGIDQVCRNASLCSPLRVIHMVTVSIW
jgi:hypothetical protein